MRGTGSRGSVLEAASLGAAKQTRWTASGTGKLALWRCLPGSAPLQHTPGLLEVSLSKVALELAVWPAWHRGTSGACGIAMPAAEKRRVAGAPAALPSRLGTWWQVYKQPTHVSHYADAQRKLGA